MVIKAGFVAVLLSVGLGGTSAVAQEVADLQITKVASSKTVRVGGTVTYTVTVTNLGPGLATDVSWHDPLPDQLNLLEGEEAWGTIGSLPSGSSVTFTYVTTPIGNLGKGESRLVGNSAILDPYPTDPDPSNDKASATVRIVGPLHPK